MQRKPEIFDIPLHDIKPLIDIPDNSLYYFIALVAIALIIVFVLIYFIVKFIKNKNKFNIRVEHLKLLNEINQDDPKKAAYDLTYYGATFKNDTPELLQQYSSLYENLDAYKYRKYVDSFDKKTMETIEEYIGSINV